jgi:L-lactate utilization protein LutB
VSDAHLSDSEKIEALWRKLDDMNQGLASTRVLLDRAEALAARRQELIQQRDDTIRQLAAEIRRLGVEVNSARTEAAQSVRKYIESQRAA